MPDPIVHPGAYKDPSGFVFKRDGIYYRHVSSSYAPDYKLLMHSGLYGSLTEAAMLVRHEEINENITGEKDWHITLLPRQLPTISYPSEWMASQLKDAALLMLKINAIALQHGMILKDATPFNIQFLQGRPVLIDSLSFEKYDEAKPWVAYRQFCECFLFPLYLHHYLDIGTGRICAAWPEGIPASVVVKMLPSRARLNAGALMHIYLQNSIGRRKPSNAASVQAFSKKKLDNILLNLSNIVSSLRTRPTSPSTWSGYYENDIRSAEYLAEKEKIFLEFTENIPFATALDIGTNNGRFALLLSRAGADIVAIDSDWQSIDSLYAQLREQDRENILPLCMDISQPTPATGFMNTERTSFIHRMQRDLVIALAVVHHLVLGNNIPMESVVQLFAALAKNYLIVEFVPPDDEKALMLVRSKDRHHSYSADLFEQSFSTLFLVEQKKMIAGSGRILYLMKKQGDEA